MHDDDNSRGRGPEETGEPVVELRDLALDPDPELPGRVHRSIQRRVFAADTLDFSLTMMFSTFWEYLRVMMESVVERSQDRED